jgi:hypothetical protein
LWRPQLEQRRRLRNCFRSAVRAIFVEGCVIDLDMAPLSTTPTQWSGYRGIEGIQFDVEVCGHADGTLQFFEHEAYDLRAQGRR